MLHASGKFVSSILSFLQPSLTSEQSEALTEFHDSVLRLLTASSESDDSKALSDELQKKMENIKSIASTYKKTGTMNAD